MTTDRVPDAVRSPLAFAGGGAAHARLARLRAEFGPVLGLPRVYVRHQGAEHFVSGGPGDTLNFPSHHPRSGLPRYDWSDRGDGVHYGYLKPDARA
jgi:hypothetical protein